MGYLKTPYVFKVKVTDVFYSKYSTGRKRRGQETFTSKINVKVKVLDVLKGKDYYTIGDTITVAYLPLWFQESETFPIFEIDEEYILPLRHWSKYSHNDLRLGLQGGSHNRYQVKNNKIYNMGGNEDRTFETWSEFKTKFKQNYLISK